MFCIGDPHGQMGALFDKLEVINKINCKHPIRSVILGDMGFKKEHEQFKYSKYSKHNKVLFGNHDYYPMIDDSHSLGRYKYFFQEGVKIFSIAGAFSIDYMYRTEGLDFFRDEEMNYMQMNDCLVAYDEARPDIVLSHTIPESVSETLFKYSKTGTVYPNLTGKFMDKLLEIWKPKIWVGAHHHKSRDINVDGTRFIVLDELEMIEL